MSKSARKEKRKLEKEKAKLQQKLKVEEAKQKKAKRIRNLKIFVNTCNFIMPFAIASGVTVGFFKLIEAGLPFYKDKVTEYKTYNVECEINGNITAEEFYRPNRLYDSTATSYGTTMTNTLTLYSPWKEKDNEYERYKRTYNLNDYATMDLYYSILNSNYEQIEKLLTVYNEEIQTINSIDENKPNDYHCEASLTVVDKDDFFIRDENDAANIIAGIVETIIGLGLGGLIAYKRNFYYLDELSLIQREYQRKIADLVETQYKLDELQAQINSIVKDRKK